MKLYFITTNKYKFKKLTEVFSVQGYELIQLIEETPELQASDNRKIASYSAKWAADSFQIPVIKEDVGLYIEALKGFPGPYLNQVEKWIETEGFLQLLDGKENRNAYWEYAIAYCEPKNEPVTFYTHQKGTIANKPRGENGYFVDKIFIPEGQKKTIAELLDSQKYKRNTEHYVKLMKYLTSDKQVSLE